MTAQQYAAMYRVLPECAVCQVEPVSRSNSRTCTADVCIKAYEAARQRVKRNRALSLDDALAEVSGRPMPVTIVTEAEGISLAGSTRTSRTDAGSRFDDSVPSVITVDPLNNEDAVASLTGASQASTSWIASTPNSGRVDLGLMAIWPSVPAMREARGGQVIDIDSDGVDAAGWQGDLASELLTAGTEATTRASGSADRIWWDRDTAVTLDEWRTHETRGTRFDGVARGTTTDTFDDETEITANGYGDWESISNDNSGDAATPRATRTTVSDRVGDGVAEAVDGWSDHRPNIADAVDVISGETLIDWEPVLTEAMLGDAREITVDLASNLSEDRQAHRRARSATLRAALPTVPPVSERRIRGALRPGRVRPLSDPVARPRAGSTVPPRSVPSPTACGGCDYRRNHCRC